MAYDDHGVAALAALEGVLQETAASTPGSEDEDIDGCDVQVEVPTSDEDLPAAEGGVA